MYSAEQINKQTNRYARDILVLYSQLLAGVDEADLLDLDALLLLEGLLDGQDLVLGLEVEGLLAAGEGLDENLRGGVDKAADERGRGVEQDGRQKVIILQYIRCNTHDDATHDDRCNRFREGAINHIYARKQGGVEGPMGRRHTPRALCGCRWSGAPDPNPTPSLYCGNAEGYPALPIDAVPKPSQRPAFPLPPCRLPTFFAQRLTCMVLLYY